MHFFNIIIRSLNHFTLFIFIYFILFYFIFAGEFLLQHRNRKSTLFKAKYERLDLLLCHPTQAELDEQVKNSYIYLYGFLLRILRYQKSFLFF